MQRLTSRLPEDLNNLTAKVLEGTRFPEPVPEGYAESAAAAIIALNEGLLNLEREVRQYYAAQFDEFDWQSECLHHALDSLQRFFDASKSGEELPLNRKTAYILAVYVKLQFGRFEQGAKEIDKQISD